LVDQRVVTTTREFFEIMRQGGATMRLVAGTADWSFGEDAPARAVDRAESTTVEQEKETLHGQLAGVLPDAHQFEFRIADAKIPIGGAVDRAISATELANFNRTWVNVDARARFSGETHPSQRRHLLGRALHCSDLGRPCQHMSIFCRRLVRMHQMTPKNGSALTPPSVNPDTAHRMCHSNC
jgi:hypothetical protein